MFINQSSKRKIKIGDLRHYIDIYDRDLITSINNIDVHTPLKKRIKAGVQYVDLVATAGDTNINNQATMIFYIRAVDNIDLKNMIVFDRIRYSILKIAPTDAYKKFLKISCVERGTVNNAVNYI